MGNKKESELSELIDLLQEIDGDLVSIKDYLRTIINILKTRDKII